MEISEFQKLIERIYYEKDSERGMEGTFMWFAEEFGELTRALRRGQQDELPGEFADVFAWLASLASLAGIDLQEAVMQKYEKGCPRCFKAPCSC